MPLVHTTSFTVGINIKGMMPIIETTNSILKATLKKESFEPAKNLRKTSDGLRMLSAMCTLLNQYGKDNFKPIMKESFNNITHTIASNIDLSLVIVFHLSTFCLTFPAYKLFGLVKRLNNWHSKLL
jgi:hypothetical protein